jgi:hypothetical protein
LHAGDADAVMAKSRPAKIVKPGAMMNKEESLSSKNRSKGCIQNRALYTGRKRYHYIIDGVDNSQRHNEYTHVAQQGDIRF